MATPEVEATSDELALAGRGFNSDVESSFKENNTSLPFDQIDAMQENSVSVEEAVRFLEEGGLLEPADIPAEETNPENTGGE